MRLKAAISAMCAEHGISTESLSTMTGRNTHYISSLAARDGIGLLYLMEICDTLGFCVYVRHDTSGYETLMPRDISIKISMDTLCKVYSIVGCKVVIKSYDGSIEYLLD